MGQRRLKGCLALLLTVILSVGCFAQSIRAETREKVPGEENVSDESIIADGVSGTLNWKIDTNGVLTVSGEGDYARDYHGFYTVNQPEWCKYAEQIKSAVVDVKDITSTACMFLGCRNMEEVNIEKLDTSKVTDMSSMFAECDSLKELDMDKLDTQKVENMSEMFRHSGITVKNFSHLKTGNVTSMRAMFESCWNLEEVNLGSINTENVVDMSRMFTDCKNLKKLEINDLNTRNVNNMSGLFLECRSLEKLDLRNLETNNVTDMSYMFNFCTELTDLNISTFDTGNV